MTTAVTSGLVVAVALLGIGGASAQVSDDAQDNTTITVNVASKIAIDITPSDLSYTTGSSRPEPGDQVFTDDSGFTAVEVENIGSENISQVWMNNSLPSENPFGSGVASAYDAGNFVQINATGEISGVNGADITSFHYVTRKDFNESNDLAYIFRDSESWRYGRFRAGSQEYFWAVNTTGGSCDGGDANVLRVGELAHNKTATGTVDFTSGGSNYYERTLTGPVSSHGLATDVFISLPGGENRTYDVLTNCGDPTYTLRTHYNVKAAGADDLSFTGEAAEHLLNASASSEDQELQPGEHFEVQTAVEVPLGVATGAIDPGTLTVVANSLEG